MGAGFGEEKGNRGEEIACFDGEEGVCGGGAGGDERVVGVVGEGSMFGWGGGRARLVGERVGVVERRVGGRSEGGEVAQEVDGA